jgi:methionyl-tRNA formyltransferase
MTGDPETGVTIMRVVKELDAGPMFEKATRPIGPDETSDVVEEALADIGAGLLIRVLDQIAEGTAHEEPQDDASATYAPRLTKEEGSIDWSNPSLAIHNRVRGLYPWPHAYTFLNGARLIVRRSHPEVTLTELTPGTIVRITGDAIHVATGNGEQLAIVEVQPEGRRPMAVRDFAAGHRVAAGDLFLQS